MSVLTSQKEGVLWLTLNRPETINALTSGLLEKLAGLLRQAVDPAVRVVAISGSGRGFSSGQDLREFENQMVDYQAHLGHYQAVVEAMSSLEKPVVAYIHGACAGAGMSLALACDLRMASQDATFFTGFSKVGLIPDASMTYTLPRLVGQAKAMELALLSPKLSAAEALELGLVNRLGNQEEFGALMQELASGPTKTYGLIKRALQHSQQATLEQALTTEAQLQGIAGMSADHQEGLQAFYQKRPAVFKGE
jgi:2-(1,2-epoxy-1,2-dihydrophenyl)acetyl-CoA isomerase